NGALEGVNSLAPIEHPAQLVPESVLEPPHEPAHTHVAWKEPQLRPVGHAGVARIEQQAVRRQHARQHGEQTERAQWRCDPGDE
ncbi:hypothetical protein, partial [Klebsiella pneumoniae]|uniref:hypothetical protein n=1 Tax=Klebsiella pneumoniae TaxID=573 RepID=UPI0027309736